MYCLGKMVVDVFLLVAIVRVSSKFTVFSVSEWGQGDVISLFLLKGYDQIFPCESRFVVLATYDLLQLTQGILYR